MGWITTDRIDDNGERIKVWIPENVHWVPPKERNRVLDICQNFKQGDKTKYDFSHTRVKPTEEQIKHLKNTVKEIENKYNYKGVAQIEISSSLNSGSLGVCFSPNNTSLISLSPQLYNGKYTQEKYDNGVKNGWNPKGTGDFIKSVLVHELGHAITCNSKNEKFWGEVTKLRSEYMKTVSKKDIENPDFISNYARTNKYEFVAEAFCQGHLSKKVGKFTKGVMDLMSKYFGKSSKVKNEKEKENNNENEEMWVEGFGYGYPIDEATYKEFEEKEKEETKKEMKQANNSLYKHEYIEY